MLLELELLYNNAIRVITGPLPQNSHEKCGVYRVHRILNFSESTYSVRTVPLSPWALAVILALALHHSKVIDLSIIRIREQLRVLVIYHII